MADENQAGDEAQVTEEAATEAETQGDVQGEPEAVFTKAQMAEMQARLDKSEAEKQKLFDTITSPDFLKSAASAPAEAEPMPSIPDTDTLNMMDRDDFLTSVVDPRASRYAEDAVVRSARQTIELIITNDPSGKLARNKPELLALSRQHPLADIPMLMALVDAKHDKADATKKAADAEAAVKHAATTAKTRAKSAGTAKPTGGTPTVKESSLQAFNRVADEAGYENLVATEEQRDMKLLEK
tara:strand:+ start:2794 stop:3516 length:723 start_codon:yes stop_codon:yes gene_type:complete